MVDFNKTVFSSTYNDDFDAGDNYHRVLFNNGRALQARELTQLQTIIQEEIARFGRNIFKEGAAVNSGGGRLVTDYRYIKIDTGQTISDVPIGTVFLNGAGVEARVLEVLTGGSDNTLYVQYIKGSGSVPAGATSQFLPGEELTSATYGSARTIVNDPEAVGSGVKFVSGASDFFVLGHFVYVPEQSIILSKYTPIANADVGFVISQNIVTTNETDALYDNSGAFANLSSPGADRYQIVLNLYNSSDVPEGSTFVQYAKIQNSTIVDMTSGLDEYNKIEDAIARRTREESGNYIVNPFLVHLEETEDETSFDLIVSDGIAYVNGYRVYVPGEVRLNVPISNGFETANNQAVGVSYGNYINILGNDGVPDLDYSIQSIKDTVGGAGSTIGTCRIRAVQEDGSVYKFYLFDVVITPGQTLSNAKSIGSGADYYNIVLESTSAVMKDVSNNNLLFDLPRSRPRGMTDINITTQRRFVESTAIAETTLTLTALGESFDDTSSWIVAKSSGEAFQTSPSITGGGTSTAIISGLDANTEYEILAYVQNPAGNEATKLLTEIDGTFTVDSDGGGVVFYDLGQLDITEVLEMTDFDGGVDLSSLLTIDNGQRDNYYQNGRLILRSGYTPLASIYCKFKFFARATTGNFYSRTSYSQIINDADLPKHTLTDGTVIDLGDVLDFRPDKLSNGTFINVRELPANGSNLTADIDFYLPRADKLLITQEGEIQLLKGEQAREPQFKATPSNSLELYKIVLNPNTRSTQDLSVTAIEHKLYTMADINKLERKLDKLEETTTLSLLELESKLTAVLDSDGNDRLLTGFVVDNFNDQLLAATGLNDYCAAVDPSGKLVRPSFSEDNVRLVYSDASSTNTIQKGDNVYINYTESAWQQQLLATESISVNPNSSTDYIGTITLSPASDEWKETEYNASLAIDGSNRIDTKEAFLWNSWMWNWSGIAIEDTHVKPGVGKALTTLAINARHGAFGRRSLQALKRIQSDQTQSSTNTSTDGSVNRVVASDSLRTTLGDRAVDIALVPWIRSQKVYFNATGLKPNTRFIPYFGGQEVSDWCKGESSFVRYSDTNTDYGNIHTTATSHPDGYTPLTTDENGHLIGSFFIPNVRPDKKYNTTGQRPTESGGFRFRAGRIEFKLLDINTNDWNAAGSRAISHYTAKGTFDNHQQGITNTRPAEYVGPYANVEIGKINKAYNAVEVKTYLNTETPNLDEYRIPGGAPNDPALSLAAIDASPTLTYSDFVSDYVNIDNNQHNSADVFPNGRPTNPLAQTFYVDNQFGVVLTSIDLFFKSRDAGNIPVQVQIRPVVNGAPSENVVVPGSTVTVNRNSVAVLSSTSSTMAQIAAAPTTFSFDEPVYLNPWTEYAIVVKTPSPDYKVYVGTSQQFIVNSDEIRFSSQLATGALFKSQNSTSWVKNMNVDMMFNLKRAVFSTSGSVILHNGVVPEKLLEANPLHAVAGSNLIYVRMPNHGLSVNDIVTISGYAVGGTIQSSLINAQHNVTAIDSRGFQITIASNAPTTTIFGSNTIRASRNIAFNVVNPYIESIVPNYTSIGGSGKFRTGRSVSGSETKYTVDSKYERLTPRINTSFSTPRVIANAAQLLAAKGAGQHSSYIKLDLKSGNNFVSPVIDLQRCSLTLINNCIDDPDVTAPLIGSTSDLDPYEGAAISKHITTPITTAQSSVGMQIKLGANVPNQAAYEVYYRVATEGENILDKAFVLQAPDSPIPKEDDPTVYHETEFLVGGKTGNLPDFYKAQIKIVMKSTNSSAVPKFRDLRVKFMAV